MSYYQALTIGQSYNFTLKAPSVLGTGYDAATVMAVMDYDTAKTIEDVASLHRAALPTLGVGIPIKASDLIYIKVKTLSGEYRVIADMWLAATPSVVNKSKLLVTINEATIDDLATVRALLISRGFADFTVERV